MEHTNQNPHRDEHDSIDADNEPDNADAADGITLTAEEWNVNAQEKVSTGQYESYEVFASVSGVAPDVDLDAAGRAAIVEELEAFRRRIRELVQDGARERLEAEPRRDDP